MKRYLITVLEPDEDRAIDIVYRGRSWHMARQAWDDAKMEKKWQGKRLRMVTADPDGKVLSINTTPVY